MPLVEIPKTGLYGYPALETDENPESWMPVVHELYPNGDLPLAGLFLSQPHDKATSDTFNWWERPYQMQIGEMTAGEVYTDVALATAYTTGGVAGTYLYVKMTAAFAGVFTNNDVVQFIDESYYQVNTRGIVTGYHINGASSYVTVKLLQTDTQYAATYNIATADKLVIIGNAKPQAGSPSEAKAYNPTKRTNVTQIMDQTLDISRTLMQTTTLRTGAKYEDLRKTALQLFMQKLERSLVSGWYDVAVGSNGQAQNMSGGIEYFIQTFASDNVASYELTSDARWSGKDWVIGGKDFLDTYIERIFRYGESQTRMAVVGSMALKGLADLTHAYGEYALTPTTNRFGMRVTRFDTPNGSIELKKHPLWNSTTRDRHRMMIIPTENVSAVVMQDIEFHPDSEWKSGGLNKFDGKKEWFLAELGWKIMHPETFGDLYGIGVDNEVT